MRRISIQAAAAALVGLLGATALPSCAPMAVVGAAIVINDEFVDNAQTAVVPYSLDYTWACAKDTMSHMTSDLIEVDEDLRTIQTYVDSALVTVQVETYDAKQTRIRVAAKRYLVYSDEIATSVRDSLTRDID
ncbi:hypothetical protein N9Z54_06075 [Planctomycetota bacterium]|nr:hypothetical protein [Planctomycetota bacterium]